MKKYAIGENFMLIGLKITNISQVKGFDKKRISLFLHLKKSDKKF